MASVSGGDRKLKPVSCKDSHPEHSLSWCLAHLSKPKHQKSDGQSLSGAAKRSNAAQWRALVAIRTHHIKGHRSSISRFRRQGGLEPLLGLIRQTDCSRKTLDLALSILGNCCTERETCSEVRKLDGIKIVVELMKKHVAQLSIQNRAARVLGNLAVDPENSALIHAAGGVPLLLLCVSQISSGSSPSSTTTSSSSSSSPPAPCSPAASISSSTISSPSPPCTPAAPPNPDPSPPAAPSSSTSLSSSSSPAPPPVDSSPAQECAQSAARALLYLSDSPPHRLSLVSAGAVASLCPLLAPDLPLALQKTSLRAVHELTRGCGVECARQIVSCGGALARLGVMAAAEEEAVQELALKTLANLCAQGCLRPLVGSLGVIGRFVAEAKKELLRGGVFLRALCLCCKEAVNRAKVKESGGLELLIGVLASHRTHPLSRFVIQACVDFVFDESAVEQFLELGLVPLLAERLVQLSKGEELVCGAGSNPPLPDLLPQGGLDSYDFPPPEEKREQALCSSSFLSLRSWLLSEGLISSEGDLLDSSSTTESDWSGLPVSSPHAAAATSSTHRPSLSPVTSSTPKNPSPPSPSSSSSPVKTPSSPTRFRLSSPLRRRPRDKPPVPPRLLPLDTPPRPLASSSSYHPYHPEPWTPESPLLLLLSRFSHVPDPSALASCEVLSALLLYLTRRADPSGRCFRMLLRLSVNPSCLQALARSGAAAMIRYRLCEREEGEEGEENSQQSPRVKAKVRQLGLSLLTNLQLQCESGFGAGVLSHTMLTGTESDRLHCALSLPLITSNKTLLRKLLLDSGGLQFALQPLGGATDSDQTSPDQLLRSLYCPLLVGCLSALTANSPSNKPHFSSTNVDDKLTRPPSAKKTHFDQSCCPYSRAEFDLAFLLDDGAEIPANRGAVSGDESGSEYFRALLRGGFGEANCKSAIRIRDVSAAMLTPVLHHLHGCRFGAAARGRCRALEALVNAGLSRNEDFEKTALGQAMVGACRFLAGDLQKELEEVCVSLLRSKDIAESCDDGQTQDEHVADQSDFEKDVKMQENPVSQTQKRKSTDITEAKDKLTEAKDELTQDKNAANQLDSEKDSKMFEIPVSKTPKRKSSDVTEAKDELTRDENMANQLDSEKDARTQESSVTKTLKRKRTDTIDAKDKLMEAKDELTGAKDKLMEAKAELTHGAGGCASVLDLLPEIYWFSQRYSYEALGGSCLSLLMGRRFSQSKAGECLRRLSKEADCVDALKKDLIALATNALS